MRQLAGIALILAIGLITSHRWFGKAKLWGRARFFYMTGEEFLLLGLGLGPSASGLIDSATLRGLEPFVGLGLGYIGFVFGMQFRHVDLSLVPARYYRATAAQNAVSAAVLAPALLAVLVWFVPADRTLLPLVLVLTATAVGTSTSFLFLLDRSTRAGRSDVFRFMRFSSGFDDLFGVFLFGTALCLLQSGAPLRVGAPALQWMAISIAQGLVAGGFLLATSRMGLGPKEELLFLLGVVLFTGGLATYAKLSPILVGTLAGVVFCNLSRKSEPYQHLLLQVEKPLYVFMLVLAGAMWRAPGAGGLALVAGAYVLFRCLGKYLGGKLATRILEPAGDGHRTSFGLGLTAQSEMAVAMAVNLLLLHREDAADLVVSTVFAAVVVNAFLSSSFFTWTYRRA